MEAKHIMPFHLFLHGDHHYVINIDGMRASSVDEATAQALTKLIFDPQTLLPFHMEERLKELGLICEYPEKNKKPLKKEPVPIVSMALFLTQSCNLKCVYCYGDGGEYGTGGSMEEKTAFRSVDWLIEQSGKMKKIHIGFFGGEPFLKFGLMKSVAEYAKMKAHEVEKDVAFHCTTNATLLDDEKIAFIKEYKISTMVSFDGPREIQDAQRPYASGKGSYDIVVPKIKKLLTALPNISGHAVLVGDNDPKLIKDAMQEVGFAEVSVMPASRSLFSQDTDKKTAVRDTQALLEAIEQEADTWLALVQNKDSDGLKILKNKSILDRALVLLLHNSKRHHACGAGRGLVGISVSGDVYLCHRFVGKEEYKLGNVFEDNLFREEYQKSPAAENDVCSACFARYYCAGGCRHDNVSSCGSMTAPSEDMCRLRCREFELAASIVSSLEPKDLSFLLEHNIFTPKPCPLDF